MGDRGQLRTARPRVQAHQALHQACTNAELGVDLEDAFGRMRASIAGFSGRRPSLDPVQDDYLLI